MEFSTFPHCGLNVVKNTPIQTIVENLFLIVFWMENEDKNNGEIFC